MLETLFLSALICGSLSALIILFTKFFLKSESYDDMIAKRKEQENELLGGKSTKREKGKKEKVKVRKTKAVEDTGKPKAEVKPMIVEEEVAHHEEELEEVEEMISSVDTPRESAVSRRNKKKRRKNVSFSDEGEPSNNAVEHAEEDIKPTVVSKEEHAPAPVIPESSAPSRRIGKDEIELKRSDDSPVIENGTSKKKKKKGRMSRNNEEEIIEAKQSPQQYTQIQHQHEQQLQQQQQQILQHQQQQQQQHQQSPQIQKHVHVQQQSSPKPQRQAEVVEKITPVTVSDQSSSKKKKKPDKRSDTSAAPTNNARPVSTRDPNVVGEEAQNLMRLLELTPLTRLELKTMSNVLVEKGGPALTDPDEELQTQMHALRLSEAAMREDLLKERSNSSNLNKTASERIQALNMKVVELQSEVSRSSQSLQEFRQYRDENERLKASLKNQKELEDRYKIVTDQFAINASQLDSTERAKKTLESLVERLQTQLKTYDQKRATMDSSLSEQLAAAQNAAVAAESDAQGARRELETAQSTLRFEQERAVKAEREVAALQLTLQTTKAELRGAAEGQEDPAHHQQQQQRAAAATASANARLEQMEKLGKEKDSKISDLESQVQRLNQQIDLQRQKNNVLRQRNWALVEEMKKAASAAPPAPASVPASAPDAESERVIALLRQELDTSARIRSQLEGRLSDSSDRLQSVQAEADKVANLTQRLRAREKELADLQQTKENYESRVTALQSDASSCEQLKLQLSDRAVEIGHLRKENETMVEVAEQLKEAIRRIEPLEKEALQLQRDLASKQQTVDRLLNESRELRTENDLLKRSSGGGGDDKLQREIDTLRTKNNELREKNWKTVEALNAAQTEAERRVKEATESSRAERRDLAERVRALEAETAAGGGESARRLQRAEQERQEAEEQVGRYKAALSETEAILRDLEQSVESEEKKWQAALHASEQECERARRELAAVYTELKKTGASREDLTDLDFAYRCVEKSLGDIVDEMEEKLVTAEDDLAEVTRQRDEIADQLALLQQQHQEVLKAGVAVPPDAGRASEEAAEALAAANSELERLRATLTAEQKSKRELAQQNTKFSALVRIGQDALKEEQDLVKKLQLQLQAHDLKQQNGGKAQNAS